MFLKKFQGQFVEIITKRDMISLIMDDKGNEKEINAPLIVTGFIVDEDASFVYLGENPIQISRALNKLDISLVEITDPNIQEEVHMMSGNGDNEDDESLN